MKKACSQVLAVTLLAISLFLNCVPILANAGVISDGVKASYHTVMYSRNGNYAYGYVTMDPYHTTTVKLYHSGTEVRSGSASGTGKVAAQTDYYKAYGTNLSSKVFYK